MDGFLRHFLVGFVRSSRRKAAATLRQNNIISTALLESCTRTYHTYVASDCHTTQQWTVG